MTDEVQAPTVRVQPGGVQGILPDASVTEEPTPEGKEVEVQDTSVIFVPFEDFTGRINQEDFDFRKDIPTKIPKSEANVWLEAKKGYTK